MANEKPDLRPQRLPGESKEAYRERRREGQQWLKANLPGKAPTPGTPAARELERAKPVPAPAPKQEAPKAAVPEPVKEVASTITKAAEKVEQSAADIERAYAEFSKKAVKEDEEEEKRREASRMKREKEALLLAAGFFIGEKIQEKQDAEKEKAEKVGSPAAEKTFKGLEKHFEALQTIFTSMTKSLSGILAEATKIRVAVLSGVSAETRQAADAEAMKKSEEIRQEGDAIAAGGSKKKEQPKGIGERLQLKASDLVNGLVEGIKNAVVNSVTMFGKLLLAGGVGSLLFSLLPEEWKDGIANAFKSFLSGIEENFPILKSIRESFQAFSDTISPIVEMLGKVRVFLSGVLTNIIEWGVGIMKKLGLVEKTDMEKQQDRLSAFKDEHVHKRENEYEEARKRTGGRQLTAEERAPMQRQFEQEAEALFWKKEKPGQAESLKPGADARKTFAPPVTPGAASDTIKKEEGLSLNPYLDPPGNKKEQYSIGHGHLITPEEKKNGIKIGDEIVPFSPSMKITPKQAETLYQQDLRKHEGVVQQGIGMENFRKLNENQKAALTSYAYNTGKVPSGIREKLDANDMTGAAESIRMGIRTSGGKELPQLAQRREREAEQFAMVPTQPDSAAQIQAASTQVATMREARAARPVQVASAPAGVMPPPTDQSTRVVIPSPGANRGSIDRDSLFSVVPAAA